MLIHESSFQRSVWDYASSLIPIIFPQSKFCHPVMGSPMYIDGIVITTLWFFLRTLWSWNGYYLYFTNEERRLREIKSPAQDTCVSIQSHDQNQDYIFFFFLIWVPWVLVVDCEFFSCSMQTLSCGMRDLVPRPGIKPGPPALGARSLSHWTTREVPRI